MSLLGAMAISFADLGLNVAGPAGLDKSRSGIDMLEREDCGLVSVLSLLSKVADTERTLTVRLKVRRSSVSDPYLSFLAYVEFVRVELGDGIPDTDRGLGYVRDSRIEDSVALELPFGCTVVAEGGRSDIVVEADGFLCATLEGELGAVGAGRVDGFSGIVSITASRLDCSLSGILLTSNLVNFKITDCTRRARRTGPS
jgi:hypothetical protein